MILENDERRNNDQRRSNNPDNNNKFSGKKDVTDNAREEALEIQKKMPI